MREQGQGRRDGGRWTYSSKSSVIFALTSASAPLAQPLRIRSPYPHTIPTPSFPLLLPSTPPLQARGLRSIVEGALNEAMFRLPTWRG